VRTIGNVNNSQTSKELPTTLVRLIVSKAMAAPVLAQDSISEPGHGDRGRYSLNKVYFGEQHLHTVSSAVEFAESF
jgi:hypothetical protein